MSEVSQESNTAGEGDDAGRRRTASEMPFPYNDLEQSIALPEAINRELGNKGSTDQVSGAVGLKGGALARRIGAAKLFGFVERQGADLVITELGRKVISPSTTAGARVEAFLSVTLFKRVYEDFRGATLPQDKGLSNHLTQLGVPSGLADTVRQLLKRSARQAGFFAFGEDRLIIPAQKDVPAVKKDVVLPADSADNGSGGGGRGRTSYEIDGIPARHPAIMFALDTLPDEGTNWTDDELSSWLENFGGVLRLVYKVKKGSS